MVLPVVVVEQYGQIEAGGPARGCYSKVVPVACPPGEVIRDLDENGAVKRGVSVLGHVCLSLRSEIASAGS